MAGETVTAALMNTHVRDNLLAVGQAWTSYTPTVAQGTSTDITKTVAYARYIVAGKLVMCNVALAMTGAGGSSVKVTVSLPVTAAAAGMYVGSGMVVDASVASYNVVCETDTGAATVKFHSSSLADVGASPAFTVASGDYINFSIVYEAS